MIVGVDLTQDEKLLMLKKKKEINYTGTRFQENPFNEEQNKETIQTLAQSQVRVLDGKIGIDGKELSSETPQVNGYGFVKTPSPMPGLFFFLCSDKSKSYEMTIFNIFLTF